MYCGIDPGNSGAIAIFKKKRVVAVFDMPTEGKVSGKGLQVSAFFMAELISKYKIKTAYVERVHSMPGQGVSSSFTFGRGLGVIEGVLAAMAIKTVFLTPQRWKKEAGLLKKEKSASRGLAVSLFPYMAEQLKLVKNEGRAEAILIGKIGKEIS